MRKVFAALALLLLPSLTLGQATNGKVVIAPDANFPHWCDYGFVLSGTPVITVTETKTKAVDTGLVVGTPTLVTGPVSNVATAAVQFALDPDSDAADRDGLCYQVHILAGDGSGAEYTCDGVVCVVKTELR